MNFIKPVIRRSRMPVRWGEIDGVMGCKSYILVTIFLLNKDLFPHGKYLAHLASIR
jgi:hypothetical protein